MQINSCAGLDVGYADVIVTNLTAKTDRQTLHKILRSAIDRDVVVLL